MGQRSPWLGIVLCCCLAVFSARAGAGMAERVEALEELALTQPQRAVAELEALRAQSSGADRVHVLSALGSILFLGLDEAGAAAVAAALEADPDPLAPSAARLLRAQLTFMRQPSSAMLTQLEELRAGLPQAAPLWMLIGLAAAQAEASAAVGRTDEAVRHLLRRVELAQQHGGLRQRSSALQALAWTYMTLGRLDQASEHATQALRWSEETGNPVLRALALQVDGFVKLEQGRREEARSALLEALALTETAGSPVWQAQMLANLADLHLRLDEFEQALKVSERALPMARAQQDPAMEALALANGGLAKVMLGRIESGRQDLAQSMAIERRLGDVPSMAQTLLEAGQAFERVGQLQAAWEAYVQRRPLAEQLVRQDRQKAMLGWQEDFDRRQRERALQLLSQEAQLQEQGLAARRLRASAGLLAAVAALLALGLTALLARRVRRANAALSDVNAKLQVQGERDPLTGLANRHRLQREMTALAQRGPLEGSVFLIDIDHFKRLNDRHGHLAGDAVLIDTARRLGEAVRGEDLLVRWGGEEFLVIAHGVDSADAKRMAQRMLEGIAGQPVVVDGRPIGFSASVGFARFPLEPGPVGVSWERAIDLVDAALYLAKAHGRNRGYGIVTLSASDAGDLAAITSSLEASHEGGRVGLDLLQGPPVREEVA